MPALTSLNPTYLDIARRLDPSGKIPTIVELLGQTNTILDDITMVEGNLETGHKSTIRNGLPTAAWRQLNYGVPQSKSSTTAITDTCGMLEAFAQIDADLAALNGNTAEFRLSEDRAFLEAMNQTMASTLFKGDTKINPERFMGLSPRYSGIPQTTDKTVATYNIIPAGGTTASVETSMWLVVWGPNTVHGIYPKGSKAGFIHEDLGLETVTDSNTPTGLYRAYRTHYQWKLGLVVRDWRYAVRICNIDWTTMKTTGDTSDTSTNLLKFMSQAVRRIPSIGMGRPVFYSNAEILSALEMKLMNKSNVWLTKEDMPNGMPVTKFWGIPVKQCDQLTFTEEIVALT